MENTKIMNEEVIEVTEDVIEKTRMNKGLMVAAGIGLGVLAGVVAYKYVVKPVVANIKTQIKLKKMAAEEVAMIEDESDVEDENI